MPLPLSLASLACSCKPAVSHHSAVLRRAAGRSTLRARTQPLISLPAGAVHCLVSTGFSDTLVYLIADRSDPSRRRSTDTQGTVFVQYLFSICSVSVQYLFSIRPKKT
jgi:hypothetical protein